jgi:hypothetical protein
MTQTVYCKMGFYYVLTMKQIICHHALAKIYEASYAQWVPYNLVTPAVRYDKTYVMFQRFYSVSLNRRSETTKAVDGYFQFANLPWLQSAFIQASLFCFSSTFALLSLSRFTSIRNHHAISLAVDHYPQSRCHVSRILLLSTITLPYVSRLITVHNDSPVSL